MSAKFRKEESLSKFVRGEISEREFAERIAELFCAPPVFYDEWYKATDRGPVLADIAADLGKKLVATLEQASTLVPKLHAIRQDMLRIKKEHYDRKRKFRAEYGYYPNVQEDVFKNIPNIGVNDILQDIEVEPRLMYIKHYFSQAIKQNIYKANDAVDLLHLFYTPEVDLMRCDRAMYNLMKHCPDLQTEKFVSTLEELPSRINALREQIASGIAQ